MRKTPHDPTHLLLEVMSKEKRKCASRNILDIATVENSRRTIVSAGIWYTMENI